jgi:hypothetical protein
MLLTCVRIVLNVKLEKELVARHLLEKELGETKTTLLKESDEHDTLRIAVGLVLNDFGMTSEVGTSSFAVQVVDLTDQAGGMAKQALHLGVQRPFTISHSHYENIDLQVMSQGFAPGYDGAELDEIEEEVAPLDRSWLQTRRKKSFLSS